MGKFSWQQFLCIKNWIVRPVQLLFKLSIHAANGSEVLMRVIKNPITDHLPVGCRKIGLQFVCPQPASNWVHSLILGTSFKGGLVNVDNYVRTLPQDGPVCFVFGGMAHGAVSPSIAWFDLTCIQIDVDYTEELVSFSEYPLSGAVAVGRLTNAYERLWNIL